MRQIVKMYKDKISENGTLCLIDIKPDEMRQMTEDLEDVKLITNTVGDFEDQEVDNIHIPEVFTDVESRIQFAVSTMIQKEMIELGDELVVISRLPKMNEKMMTEVNAAEEHTQTDITKFFLESKASTSSIQKTLSLAVSLARTGRKGSPLGALFVIGDENEVLDRSKPLNYNPFSGVNVDISDEAVDASVSEFAKLDGAFVISNDGEIVSSSRYLEPKVSESKVPSGLGSRHMAASGITESTNAVSIVVSESDQKVRCFMDGSLIATLDPNDSTSYIAQI